MSSALRLTVAAVFPLLFAFGCSRCAPASEDGTTPPPDGTTGISTDATVDAGTERVLPSSLDELHPTFSSVDAPEIVPTAMVLSLASNVFVGPFDRLAKGDVVVRVEPDIDTEVRILTASTARVAFTKPLKAGERYEIVLETIGSGSHKVTADKGKEPRHVITAPQFAFVRGQLADYTDKKKEAKVDLVFSAPIVSGAVSAHATAGGAAASSTCKAEGNVVRCTVTSPMMDKAEFVEVRLLDVRAQNGSARLSANTKVDLPRGKELHILNAAVREQPSGFVLDVVCTDDASGEPRRYEYSDWSGESFRLSPRCVLEDDALSSVHVTDNKDISLSATRQGFRVFGSFKRGSVTVRIDAGARSIDGGVLKETFEKTFTVPARAPKLELVASGRYLPRSAWRSLPLRHTNVAKGTVEVRHVPPENLVFWMNEREPADAKTSNVIYTAKVPLEGKPDEATTTWLDVSSWLPKTTRGVLSISVRGTEKGETGANDGKRLLLTDMNLIAKRDSDGRVHVWALSIEDNSNLGGVTVKSVTPSGRPVATCTTHGDGCVLDAPNSNDVDKTPPMAIVAQKGDDLTYLKYDELEAPLAESAVQGVRAQSEPPYRVALFFERGVYRPGETAHLTVLARDKTGAKSPAALPIALDLVDPRGRKSKTVVVTPNAAGMAVADFAFGNFADTGAWKVSAKTGDKELATIETFVEEFVPERMRVEVKAPAADMLSDADFAPVVSAQYLFGGSAKNSPVEMKCTFEPSPFAPANGPAGFTYGTWHPHEDAPKPFLVGTAKGTLDEKGEKSLTCPELSNASKLPAGRVLIDATVAEAGSGRVTHGDLAVRLHPDKTYLGLRSGSTQANAGKPFPVEGLVVDWDGKPASEDGTVELRLYRVETEYRWAYDNMRGSWRTFWDDRLVLETKQNVALKGGKLSATFTPGGYARAYVVRAVLANKDGRVRQTDLELAGGWWWSGSYGEGDRTPRPDAPAPVAMKLPAVVDVGASASAEVDVPFEGRALFSLEGDGVFQSEWRDVKAGKNTFAFSVKQVVPNAYVSVYVVKNPHLESQQAFTPERAFSAQSVRVRAKERALDVTVTTPAEMLPRATLEVAVQVAPGEKASVVVAAVDEGILSLTKFKTPDPVALLHPQRALGVETFETVGWNVLLPSQAPSSTTGGDEEAGDAGRVSPVKPVALFSGMVETDASGKAIVKLEVPQYRGQLRVMAFAATAGRVGFAEKSVLVREPLVMQTTLPRFLVRGDKAMVPVSVTNMSGKAREVDVRITVLPLAYPGLEESEEAKDSTKVKIGGPSSHAMNLAKDETEQVAFMLESKAAIGAVKIRVDIKSGDVTAYEELDVPLTVDAPRTRKITRMELKTGKNDITGALEKWLPTTEKSTIVVSSSPWMDALTHLQWLAHYPYGCIEQTSSGTLPLLYLGDLMTDLDPEGLPPGGVDAFAQAGVDRILSMQTPVGGFAYWPGGSYPQFWSSGFATHVLMLAKAKKLDVPQKRIDDALTYLENEIANEFEKHDVDWSLYSGEPYAHYVLAKAGKGRKARIEKLLARAEQDKYTWYGRDELRFLLNAALYASGDRRVESKLRVLDPKPITGRWNDWTFYSTGRARALQLVVLTELFGPTDTTVLKLAEQVADYLRGHASGWYTTQEIGWGVTGLGMIAKRGGAVKGATLAIDGKTGKPFVDAKRSNKDEPAQLTWHVARASERKSLEVTVPGAGPLWAVISSEGVPVGDAVTTGGDGFTIKREYLDASGAAVTKAELGDVITVVVSVQNNLRRSVQNVAIVDRLPAGFEIENPRLSAARRGAPPPRSPEPVNESGGCGGCGGGDYDYSEGGDSSGSGDDEENNAFSVEHMNIRDDRLEVFGTMNNGTGIVRYTVRAVTAGEFSAPPAETEAMYDPSIWAREAAQKIEVRGPWGQFAE